MSGTDFYRSAIISIHALLAESDGNIGSAGTAPPTISIHALLAESDTALHNILKLFSISIHALLAESDEKECTISIHTARFLSTLSLRRATTSHCGNDGSPIHFYPRSPCGERRNT